MTLLPSEQSLSTSAYSRSYTGARPSPSTAKKIQPSQSVAVKTPKSFTQPAATQTSLSEKQRKFGDTGMYTMFLSTRKLEN